MDAGAPLCDCKEAPRASGWNGWCRTPLTTSSLAKRWVTPKVLPRVAWKPQHQGSPAGSGQVGFFARDIAKHFAVRRALLSMQAERWQAAGSDPNKPWNSCTPGCFLLSSSPSLHLLNHQQLLPFLDGVQGRVQIAPRIRDGCESPQACRSAYIQHLCPWLV